MMWYDINMFIIMLFESRIFLNFFIVFCFSVLIIIILYSGIIRFLLIVRFFFFWVISLVIK